MFVKNSGIQSLQPLAAFLLLITITFTSLAGSPEGLAKSPDDLPPTQPATAPSWETFETNLHTDLYNANFPYSVHFQDLDGAGNPELVIGGVLTDYSIIPTPNQRCNWCNQWRLDAYTWDGSLKTKYSEPLDVGYDTRMRSAVGTIGGEIKVVGVGNLYPCGSGEPHAGMAVFDNFLQNAHYDWGDRQGDPCHHDFSVFMTADIADVDGDTKEEIIAGGAGDSTGGTNTYREWLLAIRTSDGVDFDEELYTHIDHGADTEILTDLKVADVDADTDHEIVATGYSRDTGVTRTWLHIMTWDGIGLQTEYSTTLDIGEQDYLHRVAIGDVIPGGKPEIILAGRAKINSTLDWYVKVLRWDGSTLTEVAEKSWDLGSDALIEAVEVYDYDQDGTAEIFLAGNANQVAVPGSTGYYAVHYYADWHLKAYSLSSSLAGMTWNEEISKSWASSGDYDSNNSGGPDPDDAGAQGRLFDMEVGDLDGDGSTDIALVGEWNWVGWHLKILSTPTIKGRFYVTSLDTNTFTYVQHTLKNAAVYLWTPTSALRTRTDDNGEYTFSFEPEPGSYHVMAELRRGLYDDPNHYFNVFYQNEDNLVWVQTPGFSLSPGDSVTKDIDFADQTLEGPHTFIPKDKWANLAMTYYYEKQAFDFMENVLGTAPTYNMPLKVFAYSTNCADPTRNCYKWSESIAEVHLTPGQYDPSAQGRPENAEWHESFHHLMQSTITIPDRGAGNKNHDGYANSNTADSWYEGYAEFWPTVMLSETMHITSTSIYNGVSFEMNYMAWAAQDGANGQTIYREDFAVAGILWDIYDSHQDCGSWTYKVYCDRIDYTAAEIWAVLGYTNTNTMRDMLDVYEALVAKGIGQTDSDGGGTVDLDEIFILHGFYADTNDNGKRDPGEEVGRAADKARPERRSTPPVPGAYLRLNFTSPDGTPINGNIIRVDVDFPPPNNQFDYHYYRYLPEGEDTPFYLELPPTTYTSTVSIHPAGGWPETDFEMDNAAYWEAVKDSTGGYAIEHTFTVEYKVFLPLMLVNHTRTR